MKFLELKYSSKITMHKFLDNLQVEKEKLASVGVDVDEKDYWSTIISSLPFALANFAPSQLAAAHLYAPTKTIVPDSLITSPIYRTCLFIEKYSETIFDGKACAM